MTDIVERLRERSKNWEIDCKFDPSCDDAQMDRDAADEIERLRNECHKLAGYLMSELVFVHERLIEEVDIALKPYLGSSTLLK